MAQWPNYSRTRFPELGLCRMAAGLWRFAAVGADARADGDPAPVGPQYRTRCEALADLARYHAACWEPPCVPSCVVTLTAGARRAMWLATEAMADNPAADELAGIARMAACVRVD